MKYYWRNYPTLRLEIGHLLLFPDGAAFDDIPTKPLPVWSESAIRQSVARFDIGRWKMAGNKMILTFPQRERKRERTLTRNPRGWSDPSEMAMNGDNINIYFPVSAPTRARLLGAWNNETSGGAGTMGGAAPSVSGGSQSDFVLSANGTFTGSNHSFFTSTTSNMGDGFQTGDDVSASGKTQSQSSGKWRLDGPLLTLDEDGQRIVHLAFLLPYWGKDAADADLMMGDQRWQRPTK